MTDRIDLDDLETGAEEAEEPGNRGDWLWRDDGGEPTDEPDSSATAGTTDGAGDGDSATETGDDDAETDGPDRTPAPHVPRTGESTPVGIPTEDSGSSSGASSGSTGSSAGGNASAGASDRGTESMRPMGSKPSDASNGPSDGTETASGPHGGGADAMTTAITYGALRRLEHPAAVVADAAGWSDWVGIVGDVPAHVIGKFQRDRGIEVDFFNGTGTGPGQRLAAIDRNSMFYADRTVVVGRAGADEPIAEAADWEFVPLETAAEKAEWELAGDSV